MEWIYVLYIFILGTLIGSFLNVVIYRLPHDLSVVVPGSHCMSCGRKLRWQHLIPLLSYICLRGKCKYCGISLSAQYPLIELITGVLFVLIYFEYGFVLLTPVYWIVTACFIAIAVIDWKYMIIPDSINLLLFITGLFASISGITIPISQALSGSLFGGGVLLLLAIISRGGMGGGDIKFAIGAGLFVGWKFMLLVIFIASFLASVYGLWKIARVGYKDGREIPFGPFLVTATIITILYGSQMVAAYVSLFI